MFEFTFFPSFFLILHWKVQFNGAIVIILRICIILLNFVLKLYPYDLKINNEVSCLGRKHTVPRSGLSQSSQVVSPNLTTLIISLPMMSLALTVLGIPLTCWSQLTCSICGAPDGHVWADEWSVWPGRHPVPWLPQLLYARALPTHRGGRPPCRQATGGEATP